MTPDDYATACKKVQSTKAEENYLVINMGYSLKMVLPFKAGIALLGSLDRAELFEDPYSSPPRITPMEKDKIIVTVMSPTEYRQHQIASLLGVPVSDIKKHQEDNPH